jgi:hypothetical protein
MTLVCDILNSPGPGAPMRKTFVPKYELPKLTCYKGRAEDGFWNNMPKKPVEQATSLISHQRLQQKAEEWGSSDKARLRAVCRDLREGAAIGCKGVFRGGSVSRNAESSYKFGDRGHRCYS